MENSLSIYGINGPLVTVKGKTDLKMSEMVYVGKEKLVGEVIRLSVSDGRNTFCYPGTRHRVQYL